MSLNQIGSIEMHCGASSEECESHESLLELARAELDAYLSVMQSDPLLPQKLWPQDYLDESVYQLHRRISREIRQRLH